MSVAVHARELQAHREVVFFCTNWMPKPSVSESKVVHAFGCCCSRGSRRDHGGARVSSSAEPRTPTQRKGLIALPMARGRGGVDGDVEAMSRTGRGGVDGDGCRRWDECPGRCGSGRAIRCANKRGANSPCALPVHVVSDSDSGSSDSDSRVCRQVRVKIEKAP